MVADLVGPIRHGRSQLGNEVKDVVGRVLRLGPRGLCEETAFSDGLGERKHLMQILSEKHPDDW